MIKPNEYDYLLSIAAIHQRAEQIFQLALEDKTHFHLYLEKLPAIAEIVVKVIQQNYPQGNIPLHSRWRHFLINGEDRSQALTQLMPIPQAKARIDLAFISVLLDAGAGENWVYRDQHGQTWKRSEALAIASLELFLSGFFAADKTQPWQVDGSALRQISLPQLAQALQVDEHNQLLGLSGRWQLLQRLSQLLTDNPDFAHARPANLCDYLQKNYGATITASDLVKVILQQNAIWPGRGDMWEYAPIGWVPFHKLSLWLTLSLIEPLQMAQIKVIDIEKLPGLAEYRNGGLFIDGGVLVLKDKELMKKEHQPGDALIIEWRALTLALLERLAPLIRERLSVDEKTLPLVNILQGGTWQAGRQLALQRSPGAESPIKYNSTGMVF